MPERFECTTLAKKRYTLPFLFSLESDIESLAVIQPKSYRFERLPAQCSPICPKGTTGLSCAWVVWPPACLVWTW